MSTPSRSQASTSSTTTNSSSKPSRCLSPRGTDEDEGASHRRICTLPPCVILKPSCILLERTSQLCCLFSARVRCQVLLPPIVEQG